MHLTKKQIIAFQKKILSFYSKNKRDLPWRKTTDPYKILISEIMLQQTQVSRVILYYQSWIQRWPTLLALAKASRKDVLTQWLGLGYNSRAIRLHEAAKKITSGYHGNIINAMKNYQDIPGIGPYTSKAVLIFSQNANIPTIDTNIRRILIHEFSLSHSISDKDLLVIATTLLPKGKSCIWHNALMDYGATFLTASKTKIRPKTKQKSFEGSDRQMRAKMLRHILKKPLSEEELISLLKTNKRRLQSILQKMRNEQILEIKNNKVTLCT